MVSETTIMDHNPNWEAGSRSVAQ